MGEGDIGDKIGGPEYFQKKRRGTTVIHSEEKTSESLTGIEPMTFCMIPVGWGSVVQL